MRKPILGFTLVELLVVISVLAILAVIGMTVFSNIQKGARDSKRKADIQAIAKAYENNYQNGSYQALLNTSFASGIIPQDPAGGDYFNIKTNDGSGFKVCTALESHPSRSCNSSSSTCYCLTSAQGTIAQGAAYSGTDFGLGSGDSSLTHNNPPGCDTNGTLDDGLIGYWRMDEGSGTVAQNAVSGGINGTFYAGDYGTADVGTTDTLLKETSTWTLNYSSNYYNGWTFKATSGPASGSSTTVSTYTVYNSQNNKEAILSSLLTGFAFGNTYHLYSGADEIGPDWSTAGKFANALYFDGIDDYVGLGNSFYPSSSPRNYFTVSAWIKPDNVVGGKYIFIKNGPVYFYLTNSSLVGAFHNGTTSISATSNAGAVVADGNWKMVTFVYDGTRIALYVGKDLVKEVSTSDPISGNGFAVIGINNNGGQNGNTSSPFRGYIDDLRFYSRALSGVEVEDLFNGNLGCTPG